MEDQCLQIEKDEQTPIFQNLLILDRRFNSQIADLLKDTYTKEDLPNLVSDLKHRNIMKRHRAVIGIRKSLKNIPIFKQWVQQVIDAGAVPHLVSLAKQTKYPHLRLEAAWALTNIAYGDQYQCQPIIDNGGIPVFARLLGGKKLKLIQTAIWGIANISATSSHYRDMLIQQMVIDKIIKIAKRISNLKLLEMCCQCIAKMCRGDPLPARELVQSGTLFLCQILINNRVKREQTICQCCWAIYYHLKVRRHPISFLTQLTSSLINICEIFPLNPTIVIPACRILGFIAQSTTQITNILIQLSALSMFNRLLLHQNKDLRRQACWIISNIAAGSQEQAEAVLRQEGLINKLVSIFNSDCDEVRKEIYFIFRNFCNIDFDKDKYKQVNFVGLFVQLLKASLEAKKQEKYLEGMLFIALKLPLQTRAQLSAQLKKKLLEEISQIQCQQSDTAIDFAKRLMLFIQKPFMQN